MSAGGSTPEQTEGTGGAMAPAAVVRAFYRCLIEGDPDGLAALAEAAFADEVVVSLPLSLPYGGRLVGAGRISRMFQAMARGPAPIGPRALTLERIVDGGDHVVARLRFDYLTPEGDTITSGALEEWTFAGGWVVGIDAFYADTAAITGG